ncbi:Fur family transcriptional regulator [Syntrophomonas zehnderi]|uniref:Fur family transcriptional regulator n=1 Tax=Syntrophomonas zehnderi TaxID=404335 RepID=UPI000625CAD1|nr:Fur family transcriptional regulator [Syntrophomonas zehnderi]
MFKIDKKIIESLDKAGYRLTQPRKAILEVMKENKGQHLTAEEVLLAARDKAPNIGIATVYRCLESLTSMDILYKTTFDEGKYRYELSDEEIHRHHHVICPACGKISEVEEDLLCSLEQHLEDQGYEVVDHHLKVYAYCPECIPK